MSDPYIGEIRFFSGSFAPVGWNFCDGSLLPIGGNDALFTLIGTTYGGDGASTFGLPDLRGRVPVHVGGGFGLGARVGDENTLLTGDHLPPHTHAASSFTGAGNQPSPKGNFPGGDTPTGSTFVDTTYKATADTVMAPNFIQPPAGSGAGHNNMQPFAVVTYIIATAGIYPSQG